MRKAAYPFLFTIAASFAASAQGISSYWNWSDRTEHIFYVSGDQKVHELYYNGGWHHNAIGAGAPSIYTGSPLTGFFDGANQHVFYVAQFPFSPNPWLQELYHDGSGWHVGQPNGGSPSNTPSNYFITPSGTTILSSYPYGLTGFWDGSREHVFYGDARGRTDMGEFYHDSSWNFTDLACCGPNPKPFTPFSSFYDHILNIEHVFYIDDDTHIREFYNNGQWWGNDLNAGGAPLAQRTTLLASYTDGSAEHVFYANAVSVIELKFPGSSGGWTPTTLPVPVRPVAGGMTAYFDGSYQHVFYFGADFHVHEMYSPGSSESWFTNDLTLRAGGPAPACGISGFFDGRVEHVFYIGEDSHMHELYFDGNWHHNDLVQLTQSEGAPNALPCTGGNGDSQ
jgi:hypothetical protein